MRRSIGLLLIAAFLPMVAFGGAAGVIALRAQREAVRSGASVTARFTAALAAAKLGDGMRAANMIAQSPAFDGNLDESRFRLLADRLRANEHSWRTLSVADAAGHRLFDVPEAVGGRRAGFVIDRRSLDDAVRTQRPVVGNLVRGPRGGYAFAVRAPIVRGGKVRYVISAIVTPEVLGPLLRFRTLPYGWRAAVVDAAGNLVASSVPNSKAVGRPMSFEGRRSRDAGSPDFYEFTRRDGTVAIGTWAPIDATGWSVNVSAPEAAFSVPAHRAIALLVAVAIASILLVALMIKLLAADLRQYRAEELAEVQRQRMEALGRLTGGVAHDFNNLLTPIIGGLDLVRRQLAENPRMLRHLDSALASAERARSLVSRLLSFSRRQMLSASVIDVKEMIGSLRELLDQAAGPTRSVVVSVASDRLMVLADRNQLELAVLNLVINARDAMPDGGAVRISASASTAAPSDGIAPGAYVAIAVADEGSGMSEETLRHAVDPFFTTKAVDEGTGLGLSMVHGFAAQSGGVLKLESAVGRGTTAIILLPRTNAEAAARASAAPISGKVVGRILLVDDQDAVRATTAEMMRDAGLKVTEASSVDEALDELDDGDAFDAVVTDYVMPGRNGGELIHAVRHARPSLPMLVITGFTGTAGDIPYDVPILPKPYRASDLLAHLARLGIGRNSRK